MTDFTALGRPYPAGFAGSVRWHVVVKHETLCVISLQRINSLFVASRAQGSDHQRLGFATGEQSGAMSAWQYTTADGNGTHGAGITPIYARLAIENP